MNCKNCGSAIDSVPCIHCWWEEGEPFSRPHWMPEDVWQRGIKSHWLVPESKKKKKVKTWSLPGVTTPKEAV